MDTLTALDRALAAVARFERAEADMLVCYILVRTDTPGLPSVGRLAAQTAHCGTQMTEDLLARESPALNELYDEWQRDTALELVAARAMVDYETQLAEAVRQNNGNGIHQDTPEGQRLNEVFDAAIAAKGAADRAKRTFGTVLTLAVEAAQMRQTVSMAQLMRLHAGVTHDPTFPIFLRDGDRTITTVAPIDSCAYVFGRKSECQPLLGLYPLLSDRNMTKTF